MKYGIILKKWSLTALFTVIPRLSEAPSFGKPVILYDADSKGAINYLNLAKEILQKNNMTKMSQREKVMEHP